MPDARCAHEIYGPSQCEQCWLIRACDQTKMLPCPPFHVLWDTFRLVFFTCPIPIFRKQSSIEYLYIYVVYMHGSTRWQNVYVCGSRSRSHPECAGAISTIRPHCRCMRTIRIYHLKTNRARTHEFSLSLVMDAVLYTYAVFQRVLRFWCGVCWCVCVSLSMSRVCRVRFACNVHSRNGSVAMYFLCVYFVRDNFVRFITMCIFIGTEIVSCCSSRIVTCNDWGSAQPLHLSCVRDRHAITGEI